MEIHGKNRKFMLICIVASFGLADKRKFLYYAQIFISAQIFQMETF